MNVKNLSLIIPTFKREQQINNILNSLKEQTGKDILLEVIICDSYSNYDQKKFPLNDDNFIIKYYNIDKNVLSSKRNYGILKSTGKYIILIDDDCIPDKDFLINYISDLEKIENKTILSGVVEYPEKYIKQNNHIRFKDLRHFKTKDISDHHEINPDKIVAMNMGFKNSFEIKNLGYFDERFVGYGFEDYEFAFRYKEKGFKLKQTKAKIIHDEGEPEFQKYIKKYYHLGRDGMKNLLLINKLSAKDTIYYKIETNFFFKLITKIPNFSCLLIILEKLILKTDKFKFMYFSSIYNIARLSSYTRGFIDRTKVSLKSNNRNWYE